MEIIKTEEEFERIITCSKAMIFIWFGWSCQARQSEKVLTEWEREWLLNYSEWKINVYKLEPDNYPFANNWLCNKVKETGGYGSLIWIKDGFISHYERYVAKIGIEELTSLTRRNFNY